MIMDLLDVIGDAIISWRFNLCFAVVVGLVAVVYWCLPDSPWRFIISVPVCIFGIVTGIVWERREA